MAAATVSGVVASDTAPWQALYPRGAQERRAVPATMLEAFQETLKANRDNAACLYFDGALDFGSVDDLSGRLATLWWQSGLRAGDRIAVILQNVPHFAVAVVAAWKIGAIPVTINPMYRVSELEKLFADCAPKAVLCHNDHFEMVAAAAAAAALEPASILTASAYDFQNRNDTRAVPPQMEAGQDLLVALDQIDHAAPVAPAAAAEDIALILYTSGTTGVPKGATLSHRALVANAVFCRDWFPLSSASRIFGMAPLFHITGFVCHLCASFISGAPLILTYRFVPEVALEAFRELRPTFVIGAITAFIALMQARGASPSDFESFEAVYSGGAPVPPAVVDAFAARFGKSIRSCYGMTETAAPALFSPPDGVIPVDPESGAIAVGVPIPGTDAKIIGEDGQPLVAGQAGELLVRGPQVMTGYWHKPVETSQVLVDGWMHTGDVAFSDHAGWFYLVDRKKDMICASGFKVWPREVEDTLYAHPAVREAAVVGAPDAYRGETVIAYVALRDTATAGELIAWCRERLAAYKAPREIEILSDLPKTVTGKIMRAELRAALHVSREPGKESQ